MLARGRLGRRTIDTSRRRASPTLVLLLGLVAMLLPACGSTDQAQDPVTLPPGSRPSSGCTEGRTKSTSTQTRSIEVDGEERHYDLTLPSTDRRVPRPVVVDLHGVTGTSEIESSQSGLTALGSEEGFIDVAPQGLGEVSVWDLDPTGKDVVFLTSMLDEVEEQFCVDLAREYLTGFSAGGMMAMVMACVDPARFAAIAPVEGMLDVEPCPRPQPVPLISFHGTADNSILYEGGVSASVELLTGVHGGPPIPDIAAGWATANGCAPTPNDSAVSPNVTLRTFECPSGAATELYIIEGGPHLRPGNPDVNRSPGGEVDASRLLWAFLEQFTRPS